MMNKKRLAALAMSAVMAAGTVSIPVNAADFSDGAAVQEATAEAETLTVDVVEEETPAVGDSEVIGSKWESINTETPKLTITLQDTNGTYTFSPEAKDYKKVSTPASCGSAGGYIWTVVYMNQEFKSDFVKTSDALGHDWKEAEFVTVTAPSCEGKGLQELRHECNRCKTVEAVKDSEGKVIVNELPPQGHEVDRNAATTKVEYRVSVEASADGVVNTKLDTNGNVVLDDPTKDGKYGETVTGICTECGQEVHLEEEIKTLKATMTVEGTSEVTEVSDNIVSDIKGKDPEDANFPKNDEIVLKDCSKDAYYIVTVYSSNNEIIDTIRVDVKAHHVLEKFNTDDEAKKHVKCADENDKGLLTITLNDNKEVVVTNNSCLKDIKYTIERNCVNPDCKYIDKTEKVAAKSDRHSTIQTSLEKEIESLKDKNGTVDYDKLLAKVNELGKDGKYAKVVNVTATCDKNGTADVELYCQVCGEKVTTISGVKVSMEHKYVTKSENKVEATCQSAGSYDSVTACERCGKEQSRKTITIQRLTHTNELTTNLNGDGKDITDSIFANDKKTVSDASIKFAGSLVFGPENTNNDENWGYKVNEKFDGGHNYTDEDGNIITSGKVSAVIITNCAVCHNNEVKLTVAPQDIKVKAVTKETRDIVTGKATAPGSITLVATYTEGEQTLTKEITLPYYSEPMDTTVGYTGLHKDVDGVYRYYVNGEFDEDYAGIVEFDGKEFFVANGVLCKDAMGLNQNVDGKWYFLAYGQIQKGHAGLVEYDGAWFYVDDEGELKEEITGLVDYDGGTFLFINGRLAKEVNGLWQNSDSKWYFLANGQVQKQHTGLALYDGEWFYVVDGMLAEDFTGNVEYDGETFKVVNGMLR